MSPQLSVKDVIARYAVLLLVLVSSLWISSASFADRVYFRNGRTVNGEVVQETDDEVVLRVKFKGGEGLTRHKRGDIERVEKEELTRRVSTKSPMDVSTKKTDLFEWFGGLFSGAGGGGIGRRPKTVIRKGSRSRKVTLVQLIELDVIKFTSGFLADFFIFFLIMLPFLRIGHSAVRANSTVMLNRMERATNQGLFFKWLYISGGLLILQCQLYKGLSLMPYIWESRVIYMIILYESMGLIAMIAARENYIKFLRRVEKRSVLTLKLPLILEYCFFIYLAVYGLFVSIFT